MAKYIVLSNSLSVVTGKDLKKGEEVGIATFGVVKTKSLIDRGFLKEIKGEEKKEKVSSDVPTEIVIDGEKVAVKDYKKMTVDALKEYFQELGVEVPDGNKAAIVEGLEEALKKLV